MGGSFTDKENQVLMPLVADCVNYGFSEKEALSYIKARLGKEISTDAYYRRKRQVDSGEYANQWMSYFTRVEFVVKHQQIIEVVEMVQKDTIRNYLIEQNKSPAERDEDDIVGAQTAIHYSGNIMRGADIMLNLDGIKNIRLYVGEDAWKSEILHAIKDTITHEIGHTLGLGHANSKSSIMYPKNDYNSNGEPVRETHVSNCEAYFVFAANGYEDEMAAMEDDMSDKYPDEVQTVEDAYKKICELWWRKWKKPQLEIILVLF